MVLRCDKTVVLVCFLTIHLPPRSTRTDSLFPYTTLCRSRLGHAGNGLRRRVGEQHDLVRDEPLIPPVARLLERPRPDPAGIDDRLHGGGRRRAAALPAAHEIGRASCRERVCQYV